MGEAAGKYALGIDIGGKMRSPERCLVNPAYPAAVGYVEGEE